MFFVCQPATNIFEDFEPPSEKFLAMPLLAKGFKVGTKNLARLYMAVCKAGKICLNRGHHRVLVSVFCKAHI